MTRGQLDAAVAAVAGAQYGVVGRGQILALGGDDRLIHRRVTAGRLRALDPGVYALQGWPRCWEQELWRALQVTAPGGVASHQAAAVVHGLWTGGGAPVVVLLSHDSSQRPRPGMTVRRSRRIPSDHLTTVDSIPVTTVERTIVDLAAVVRRGRLEAVVDDAVSSRRTSYRQVAAVAGALAGGGRRGSALLGRILDERTVVRGPAQSSLERRLHQLVAEAGLPPLQRQFGHPGRQHQTGCVDGAWPEVRLVVEVDGRRWHTRIADLRRDHERDLDAARQGWITIRLLYEDIVGDPEGTIAALLEAYGARLQSVA